MTSPLGPDSAAAAALAETLPAADYQHRLRLQRVEPAEYFRTWDATGDLLRERRYWIERHPERHGLALPEAAPFLHETGERAKDWLGAGAPAETAATSPAELGAKLAATPDLVAALGRQLEPDLVWLARDGGRARVVAATVCFPSAWSPETKLGLDLRAIHDVVPALNAELGDPIDAFLDRLRPGVAWRRANWGLSASAERNQHPARGLPRLEADTDPAKVWLRLEHQALLALPKSHGVLFGIRIEQTPLPALRANPSLATALARALATMPAAMAAYKGLGRIRARLLEYLADHGSEGATG